MTIAELKKARQSIPGLFAAGVDADIHKVGSQESGFSFFSGIPSAYSSFTGKKVCRADVNGIGRLCSQPKWFNQMGGYYTFSQEVSDAIGGYPIGAILYFKDEETGYVRLVRSLIPDNDYDFTEDKNYINDVYWQYVDNVKPVSFRPRVFPDMSKGFSGTLYIGQELRLPTNCLFSIQMGANVDRTTDDADLYVYLTVKKTDDDTFYTASLLTFLPASAAVITQGIMCRPDYETDTGVGTPQWYLNSGNHPDKNGLFAYNSPSPVRLYFNAGDTLKITMNRDYAFNEGYAYTYYPLKP